MTSDESERSVSSSSDSDDEKPSSANEDSNEDEDAAPEESQSQPSTSEDGEANEEMNDVDGEEEKDTDSEEGDDAPKKNKSGRRGKMDDATLKFLREENYVRRSSRKRKAVDSSDEEVEEPPNSNKGRKRKRNGSSESAESSSDSDSDDYGQRKRAPKKPASKKVRTVRASKTKAKEKVNYQEESSESEVNSDDVLEWDDGKATPAPEENHTEVVEKVLRHRYGVPAAVGSSTTEYNVQVNGEDPNTKAKDIPLQDRELQFLIKWQGWSHWHNTWESQRSLELSGAKGHKKIENFMKRMREIEIWKQSADKEYIEVYDCEQEMNDELYEQYKMVERVIGHQISREKTNEGDKQYEYFCKWSCLSYADCTWEDEALVRRYYGNKVDEYMKRLEAQTVPHKSQVCRKRLKFVKLDQMPDFLRQKTNPDMELRDYQLEGLNWLLHAWSKENSCILADEMGLGKTIQSISFLSSLFHLHELYGPFLVVVPLSTMAAWQREFEAWAPDVNVVTYVGDVTSREQIRQYELFQQGTKKLRVNVFLTTYEILLKDKAFLGTFNWQALMVDEAHRLKNNESLLYQCLFHFNTAHRVLITGTPLQNSLKELWALLHFIMPDRVKKDVEKSLPAKVEQILRVDMTVQQKQYYKWILTKNYEELSKGVKGSINGFVNVVMELKKCCNHSSLVRQYDNIHCEAQSRLQQLLKSSGKLILLDKLLCRLKETGHRVLIFSQMVMMLDILQEYMSLRRFATQRLDGSMRSDLRKQALDHFNAEGSTDFCFLLSTRAGGLGINLATADTVIIFDSDWNPQNDLQAMSRAHRIGQKKQVNIYRLVTKNSVEENIVERAKQKLVLDHLVIQRMDTTGKTVLSKSAVSNSKIPFDKNDLNAILKFGAEELFKEKDGEEQELEVNIDDILSGAETRECDNIETGNELLNAFKYANFVLDEEKDLAMLNTNKSVTATQAGMNNVENKSWDDIIPKDKLDQIKNEELLRMEAELNLGPRNRVKVNGDGAAAPGSDEEKTVKKKKKGRKSKSKGLVSESESSDSDSETPGRGRKGGKKKVIFNFTDKEVRRFMKSFRKFAAPLERLDSIAQDAELEDRSTSEINELTKEIQRRCAEAQENHSSEAKPEDEKTGRRKQDRGPTFKVGTVDVYVRPLLKAQQELEPLHELVKLHGPELRGFTLPSKVKEQAGWDLEWSEDDDLAVMRGIYKYGYGSWESIKMDPDLGLADKVWIKDKVKKPQPKHLQARVDYLLRNVAKVVGGGKKKKAATKKMAVKRQPKEKTDRERKEKARERTRERPEKAEKKDDDHKSREKGNKYKSIEGLKFDLEKYGSALVDKRAESFQKVVDAFRPMSKYIKRLVDPATSFEHDGAKALNKIGDFIVEFVGNSTKKWVGGGGARNCSFRHSSWSTDRWFNLLWLFVSQFFNPAKPPEALFELYMKNAQSKEHKEHRHSGVHRPSAVAAAPRPANPAKESSRQEVPHADRHHHHHHHHRRHSSERDHRERAHDRNRSLHNRSKY